MYKRQFFFLGVALITVTVSLSQEAVDALTVNLSKNQIILGRVTAR